jgi:hypothetical protein
MESGYAPSFHGVETYALYALYLVSKYQPKWFYFIAPLHFEAGFFCLAFIAAGLH